jgi:hypothetical protein
MDTVKVWLAVESRELSVADLESLIGLKADKSWSVGEPRGKSGLLHNINCWTLQNKIDQGSHPELQVGQMIGKALEQLFGRITSRVRERLKELSGHHDLVLGIGILSRQVPEIHFHKEQIRAFSDLGLTLDLDLVLYGNEGDRREKLSRH